MTFPRWLSFGFSIEAKGLTRPHFRQVHGSTVIEVRDAEALRQLSANPPSADGAFSVATAVELSVFTADCIPLLLFSTDPEEPIGIAHSGWRGTKDGIANELLSRFPDPSRVGAILGPSILKCCFEVKEDLLEAFREKGYDPALYTENRAGRLYFDLSGFVIQEQLGSLPKERIDLSHLRCTHCSLPKLPSYRRDKATDPTIRSWIRKAPDLERT